MNIKQELQRLNNQLDKRQKKFDAAKLRLDYEVAAQATDEIEATKRQLTSLQQQQTKQLSVKAQGIQELTFSRPITKAEQADMGKLKKSVRGLIVVHPMTALGREMSVQVVTGFARAKF
jgi:ribosome-associated protein